MAVFKFTESILAGRPIELYAGGALRRDFTFVDDVARGIIAAVDHPPVDQAAHFRAYNLGRGAPTTVIDMVDELERCLGRRAVRKSLPPQLGDVSMTYADTTAARADLGYRPSVSLRDGIQQFVEWYLNYSRASQTPMRRSA
jgi:UDP-glucuronate 4-epimerase